MTEYVQFTVSLARIMYIKLNRRCSDKGVYPDRCGIVRLNEPSPSGPAATDVSSAASIPRHQVIAFRALRDQKFRRCLAHIIRQDLRKPGLRLRRHATIPRVQQTLGKSRAEPDS